MDIRDIIQQTWPGWYVVKVLGSGSYGSVYLVERQDIIGNAQAAVKVVSIPQSASELDGMKAQGLDHKSLTTYLESQVQALGEEIRLMETVKGYTNIVSIEDYHVLAYTEIPQWFVLIRMELLTPLYQHISNHPLSENDVIKAIASVGERLQLIKAWQLSGLTVSETKWQEYDDRCRQRLIALV